MKTVILASGGTGGHIFPAIAVSDELKKRGYKTILITDKRAEKYIINNSSIEDCFSEIHTINTSSLSGNIFKKVNAAKDIGIGYFQAQKLLKDLKPNMVVGFGGYPSFPTMYAACSLSRSKPNLLTLVHEQNSVLGQVNAFLADKVQKIATSFRETGLISKKNNDKQSFVGNPVRDYFKVIRNFDYKIFDDKTTFKILVVGGSQGASIFSNVIPEAISGLPEEIRNKIRIDQQCRKEDVEKVAKIYNELNISADVAAFYEDIAIRISSAHLVIARCGASTVSELSVAGRPAIFVPYKFAKDNHQMKNAISFKMGSIDAKTDTSVDVTIPVESVETSKQNKPKINKSLEDRLSESYGGGGEVNDDNIDEIQDVSESGVALGSDNNLMESSNELNNDFVIEEKDFTSEELKSRLIKLFNNPDLLENEAKINKKYGIPDADIKLADLIEKMIEQNLIDNDSGEEYKDCQMDKLEGNG